MNRPTYEELELRLTEAQQIIAALRGGEVDAIISERDVALLCLEDVKNALRGSEENYRNSMEKSPLGIRIATEKGELLYANQATLDIYGYSSIEELRALPAKQRYTPESYAEHEKRKEKRKRGEYVPSNYEISVVRKDGEIRHVEVFRKEVLWNGKTQFQILYQDITERKRAEAAVKSLAKFPDENPNPIVRVGGDGTVLYANKAAGLLVQSLGGAVGSPAPALWGNLVTQALASQAAQAIDVEHDGRVYAFDVIPITEGGYVNVYARDVTEPKQMDRSFHNQHDLAVALSSTSQLKEGARLCLEAALNISGMDCGGLYLVDKTSGALDLLFHQGLSSDFVKAVAHYAADSTNAKLVMAGKPVYTEHLALGVPLGEADRREGLRAIAVVPVSHEGRVIGCLNIASHALGEVPPFAREMLETVVAQAGNAIARLQSEEALTESERKLRALFKMLPVGVSILDAQRKILYTNPALEGILDISREGLFKGDYKTRTYLRPDGTLMPAEEFASVRAIKEERAVHNVQTGVVKEDGEVVWISVSAVPVAFPDWRIVVVTSDITERKRAEAERERLLADLEAKNRELESFVYTVSHDLKAPLVSLSGFSSALQKGFYNQLSEEGKHYLQRIQANLTHMNALIASLLELSRIGQVVGRGEEIDVAALLRGVQDKLVLALEEARAEFLVQEPLPTVHADRGRIHQVFVNLIDNAVKFRSVERALHIEVGCRQESGFYCFHVADNGIGIAPQYHEHIFAPFRKLHPEIEGMGIGLALVKKIVEHHGGRVWAQSPSAWLRAGDEGTGATFYFTLPIQRGIIPHSRSPKPEGLS